MFLQSYAHGRAKELKHLNELRGQNIDLIRTVAIIAVLLLHASGEWLITSQEIGQLNTFDLFRWSMVDIYQTIARIGVPLFIMLNGALLLPPTKNESLKTFFKKRWVRIGLPTIFWGAIYFAWDFLVIHTPFTLAVIAQGILNGPYTQFWFIYVLIGLYLLTPILRIFIAHADKSMIKYFVILWLLGVAIIPVFGLLTPITLSNNVFIFTGFAGYFVLGLYLLTVQTSWKKILFFIILGTGLTAFGTYVLAYTVGGTQMYFFQQYFSPTVILASVMIFLLLLKVKPPSIETSDQSKVTKLIKIIGANTLPIFFIHVMILESIENGYFGFFLNRNTLNPIVEVPLMTLIVLFVSLGIILLLKKIPHLKQLVG
jgi:surface polysaccharide O-acyltransferase-like enzyme